MGVGWSYAIKFEFGVFLVDLSIFFYLYQTTGIERTAGLITMKFGMSICDGCGVVIHNYIFYFHIFVYVSIFFYLHQTMGLRD